MNKAQLQYQTQSMDKCGAVSLTKQLCFSNLMALLGVGSAGYFKRQCVFVSLAIETDILQCVIINLISGDKSKYRDYNDMEIPGHHVICWVQCERDSWALYKVTSYHAARHRPQATAQQK